MQEFVLHPHGGSRERKLGPQLCNKCFRTKRLHLHLPLRSFAAATSRKRCQLRVIIPDTLPLGYRTPCVVPSTDLTYPFISETLNSGNSRTGIRIMVDTASSAVSPYSYARSGAFSATGHVVALHDARAHCCVAASALRLERGSLHTLTRNPIMAVR
ncbi:hypothetical protein EVAR_94103_1 [Eumeta japonica]|uniref:Uncharacterized protein n=1 Tax=Eumeta variegata TaxID=151549 RepID=A0A4C1V5J0_EUMVA|nr:hypothetical protein EVAR_94103_1 [Eumeta japonica]